MNLATAHTAPRGVVLVVAEGLALLCVVAFAWSSCFGQFVDYDDQGYLQLAVQHVLAGRVPYDEVAVPYGPIYFLERWILHGILRLPLTTDGTRLVTFVTWVASVWFLMCATRRALAPGASSRMWSVVACVLAGISLAPISKEPGHPQELFVLVASATAWAAITAPHGSRWRALVWGALCGALLMTKINVGVFALVACTAGGAFLSESRRLDRVLRWAAVAVAIALPLTIMWARIDDLGVREFALASTLGLVTLAACDWRLGQGRAASRAHPALALTAVLLLTGAGVVFACSRGSTLDALIEQLVRTPSHLASGFKVSSTSPPGSAAVLLGGSALGLAWACAGAVWRARIERLGVPLVRVALFALLCSSTSNLVLAFNYLPGLVWVLLLPAANAGEDAGVAAWRRALVWFVLLERLQAYPVMGSQMRLGIVLVYPLVVWGAAQAWMAVSPRGASARTVWRAGPAFAATLALGCGVVLAATTSRRYVGNTALNLPGAHWLRLSPHSTGIKRWLAFCVRPASTFVPVTANNSLYSWTEKQPPDCTLISHSWELISDQQQRHLVAALRAEADPWIIDRDGIFLPITRVGRPFFDFARDEFRSCARFAGYGLLVRRERSDPEFVACGTQAETSELPASLRPVAARRAGFWFDMSYFDLPAGTAIARLELFELLGGTVTAVSDGGDTAARIGCFTRAGDAVLADSSPAPWTLTQAGERGWLFLPEASVRDKTTSYFLHVRAPGGQLLRALPLVIRPTRRR